jgi:hypothetical protein
MMGMHWNRYVVVTLLVGRLFQSVGASFQPSNITVVQTLQRNFGPMMFPEGSPWCDGNPAYWWSGHWYPEVPYCERSPGNWEPSKLARLDLQVSYILLWVLVVHENVCYVILHIIYPLTRSIQCLRICRITSTLSTEIKISIVTHVDLWMSTETESWT